MNDFFWYVGVITGSIFEQVHMASLVFFLMVHCLIQDYDRVFSSMGIPACLWRRTGEIYKGNKEFAALVGVPIEQLREVG